MSEARGSIGHDIGDAGHEGHLRTVPVVALVLAGALAEVSGRAAGGGGAFIHAGDGGSVVAAGANGAFAEVEVLADHVEVCVCCQLFEVTVGEVAVRVGV